MAKTTSTLSKRLDTQEIRPEQWIPFLVEFTRENRGAHARLEILGGEAGYNVETENRPLDGVAADVKDGERSVWIIFGSTPDNHLTHGIQNVKVVRVLPATASTGAVLEVEAQDGTITILELSLPAKYELPPGSAQKSGQ